MDALTEAGVWARVPTATSYQRALVSLEGLSLGDAFGETFFDIEAGQPVGSRPLRAGTWAWTDDTAMAVAIVETLVAHNTIDQDYLAKSFAARYSQGPARGYSAATHRSLSAIKLGVPWRWAANSLFGGAGSCGNGAAMRASVVGAWFAHDLDRVVHEARLSAEVTHTHPEGVAGAIAVAVAAALACSGERCPVGHDFIQAVLDEVPEGEVRQLAARGLLIGFETPIGKAAEALGNGSALRAQDTVPLVLWCAAQRLRDYESALWLTVAALGDRDTTCAMVGGIVACHTGAAGLPAEWLAHREPLPAV